MKLPVVRGLIDRRILLNFRAAPEILEKILPPPFRPKIVHGWALAGICLIRLKRIRPLAWPAFFGLTSENAAHRFAVEWETGGMTREGVFIPRRDTSSHLNAWAGGRLFPGVHHRSDFEVQEDGSQFSVCLDNDDRTHVFVKARLTDQWPPTSVFPSLAAASEFFARGSLGFSVSEREGRFDGLELRSFAWHVEPLDVERIESSLFDDRRLFPDGSIAFDCALLMQNIPHEWHARGTMCHSGDLLCK